MKFSEEQLTELVQYATDQRNLQYKVLKNSVVMEDEDALDSFITEKHLEAESMLRLGQIHALYKLLYKTGAISWDDCLALQDEAYEKFKIENIREEIRNQRSLNI